MTRMCVRGLAVSQLQDAAAAQGSPCKPGIGVDKLFVVYFELHSQRARLEALEVIKKALQQPAASGSEPRKR